ncbi:hypothetical protein CTEN210_16159 [Chaetoceros tenuissimus]|uniref:Protein kinase domain-containing protein n=1 Tax=Chaetoceros tenuissimus TaxID=426638 RepID=A0AAD3D8H8_9STRA|nr:hypothetical protein CTEN210_16159 [Chaetoceros tenuissimus]
MNTSENAPQADVHETEIERIKLLRQIGSGAFSTVHLAQHITLFRDHTRPHLKLALKLMPKSQIEELNLSKKVEQEINSLKACNHPHIMKLYKVMETPHHVILVNDYLNAGELHDYMLQRMKGTHKSLPRTEARRYFQEIASAIGYFHEKKICHRDLKLENILLYKDHRTGLQFVKIVDFGFSHVLNGDKLTTACGSPFFAAPEIISNQAYFGDCVDVWACGVILYVMVCGKLPFQEKDMKIMYTKIRTGEYELPNHLQEEEKELILGMMKVDPSTRMNMQQVCNGKYYLRSLPHYLDMLRLESKDTDMGNDIALERNHHKEEKEKEYISNHIEACSRVGQILQTSSDPIYRNIPVNTVESIVKNEEEDNDECIDSFVTAMKSFKTRKMKVDDDWEDNDENELALPSEVSQDIILVYKMCLEEILIARRIKELTRGTMWKKILLIAIVAIVLVIVLSTLL